MTHIDNPRLPTTLSPMAARVMRQRLQPAAVAMRGVQRAALRMATPASFIGRAESSLADRIVQRFPDIAARYFPASREEDRYSALEMPFASAGEVQPAPAEETFESATAFLAHVRGLQDGQDTPQPGANKTVQRTPAMACSTPAGCAALPPEPSSANRIEMLRERTSGVFSNPTSESHKPQAQVQRSATLPPSQGANAKLARVISSLEEVTRTPARTGVTPAQSTTASAEAEPHVLPALSVDDALPSNSLSMPLLAESTPKPSTPEAPTRDAIHPPSVQRSSGQTQTTPAKSAMQRATVEPQDEPAAPDTSDVNVLHAEEAKPDQLVLRRNTTGSTPGNATARADDSSIADESTAMNSSYTPTVEPAHPFVQRDAVQSSRAIAAASAAVSPIQNASAFAGDLPKTQFVPADAEDGNEEAPSAGKITQAREGQTAPAMPAPTQPLSSAARSQRLGSAGQSAMHASHRISRMALPQMSAWPSVTPSMPVMPVPALPDFAQPLAALTSAGETAAGRAADVGAGLANGMPLNGMDATDESLNVGATSRLPALNLPHAPDLPRLDMPLAQARGVTSAAIGAAQSFAGDAMSRLPSPLALPQLPSLSSLPAAQGIAGGSNAIANTVQGGMDRAGSMATGALASVQGALNAATPTPSKTDLDRLARQLLPHLKRMLALERERTRPF